MRTLIAALGIALAAPVAWGQTAPGANTAAPSRGTPMTEVEKRLGQPMQIIPAVGQPPITRWVYDTFTVYFENDRVIHSVANDKTPKTTP
jgi:hypothetical protein